MAVFSAFAALLASAGSFIGGLSATSIGAFLLKTAVGIGVGYLKQAIAGKPKQQGFGIQGKVQTGEEVPVTFILGEGMTAGQFVYGNSRGKANKSENAYLTQVIKLANLPVKGLKDLWVNGEIAEVDWETESDLNGMPVGHPITSYNRGSSELAWIRFYDGTQTEADPYCVQAFGGHPKRPYGSNRVGRGCPYVVITTRIHKSAWSGIPQFKFIVDGMKLYDPSRDSTVGGSGPQRWGDRSTWGGDGDYLPAVQIYNILRGITYDGKWVYGLQNLPAARLPIANWIEQIEKCRLAMQIGDTEETEPQYRSGGEVAVDVPVADGLETIFTACNGRLAEIGGIYKLNVGKFAEPVFNFDDGMILSTEQQSFTPFFGLDDRINGVTGKFPNPEEAYAWKDAKPIYRTDLEIQDGNRRLLADVSFDFAPYPRQVQRLMKSALREAQRERRHTIVLPSDAYVLEPLDVVTWTSARNGYVTKRFRVDGVIDKTNLDVVLDVTEIDPSDYDFGVAEYTAVVSGPMGPVARNPQTPEDFAVAPYVVAGAGGRVRPGIRLSWNGDQDDVEAIGYQVRLAAAPGAQFWSGRSEEVAAGEEIISESLTPVTDYEVRAIFLPFTSRETIWSDWKPVTTPNARFSAQDLYDDAIGWETLAPEIRQFQEDTEDALQAALGNDGVIGDRLDGLDTLTSALDATLDQLEQTTTQGLATIGAAVSDVETTVAAEQGRLTQVDQLARDLRISVGNVPSDRAAAEARLGQAVGGDLDAMADALIRATLKLEFVERTLRDAGVIVDPATGVVKLYAVDAVRSETTARIADVQVLLDAQAAAISLRATLTEVDSRIASALSQTEPAVRWEWNGTVEGWTASGATLGAGASALTATRSGAGSATITSPAISVNAAANPTVQLRMRRTAGVNWGLTFAWDNGSGFSAPIEVPQPADGVDGGYVTIRVSPPWTGMIGAVRLGLGAETGDAFAFDYLSIGPAGFIDAVLGSLDAKINQVEVELDALAGSISQYALSADLGAAVDRIGVAEQTLDAQAAEIGQRATLVQLGEDRARLSTAESRLSAAEGSITNTVTAMQGVSDGTDQVAEAMIRDMIDGQLGAAGRFADVAFAQEKLGARIIDGETALATYKREVAASIDGVTARIATEETSRATAVAAEATARGVVEAQINSPTTGLAQTRAELLSFAAAQAFANTSYTQSINSLSGSLAGKADSSALTMLSSFVTQVDLTKSRTLRQTAQPAGTIDRPLRAGDVWIRPGAEGEEFYVWTGTSWFRTRDQDLVAASTSISNLTADLATANARITTEETARASGDAAEATARGVLSAQVNNATTGLPATRSALLAFQTAQASQNSSFASQIGSINTELDDLATSASIQELTNFVGLIDATKNATYRQATAPAGTTDRPLRAGDTWLKTLSGDSYEIAVWTGSQWIRTKDVDIVSAASSLASLTAQVNHPSTGLAKTRADFTSFQSAQATTNSANSQSIQNLNSSLAGKANTSVTDALQSQVTSVELTANGKNRVFRQASIPSASAAGDLWFRTDQNNRAYVAQGPGLGGGNWVLTEDDRVPALRTDVDAQASRLSTVEIALPGKAATSVTDALTSRVTTAENTISSQAGRITSVENALPGKASTTALSALDTRVTTAQTTADGKSVTWRQPSPPPNATGNDIWFDADDGDKAYRLSGSTWVPVDDKRIGQLVTTTTAQASAITSIQSSLGDLSTGVAGKADASAVNALTTRVTTVEGVAGGKNKTFRQGPVPTAQAAGDLWYRTNDNNRAYRAAAAGASSIGSGAWELTDDTRITSLAADVLSQATALTGVQASYDDLSASGTFRAVASAGPSGYASRISLQARTGSAGSWSTAGFYIDVPTSGHSRIAATADRFIITNGAVTEQPFEFSGSQLKVKSALIPQITTDSITFQDGSVQTSALAPNATTNIVSGQIVPNIELTGSLQEMIAAEITITEGVVYFATTIGIRSGSMELELRRNGTSIRGNIVNVQSTIGMFHLDNPGPGTHTYSVWAKSTYNSSPWPLVNSRSIILINYKR